MFKSISAAVSRLLPTLKADTPKAGGHGSKWRALGMLAALSLSSAAWALPITKSVTINVYDVCDNSGNNCASKGPVGDSYFQAEINKIWAQAGISVSFNFVGNLNSTFYSNIDDGGSNSFYNLARTHGHGITHSFVDMYLVHTVADSSLHTTSYGEGWLGWGGLAIAMDTVMSYNGGVGRIDTIAHELGHNLGLDHYDSLASDLMASGGVRSVATTSADIAPSGLGYDYLTSAQITTARSSTLLKDVKIPEPTSMLLLLLAGTAATVAVRRRV